MPRRSLLVIVCVFSALPARAQVRAGNYCPTDPVARDQMAVFLTTTFGLTLY